VTTRPIDSPKTLSREKEKTECPGAADTPAKDLSRIFQFFGYQYHLYIIFMNTIDKEKHGTQCNSSLRGRAQAL
jgi:hypothetical protein